MCLIFLGPLVLICEYKDLRASHSLSVCVCVCVCSHACAIEYMGRKEDNLQEPVLFSLCGSRAQTQIIRRGGKWLCPLSPLSG